ncbi:hypothetical protein C2G38_2071209 [Gigaspora rosea]|uniref:Uncharacterized protein n=1 Tax=Gigaspora rosea TaxID=44941 RepID=A0A397VPV0_9GLOM|nr:hypothetical protein C2G38_2071209 [Gigaspora rosea]
MVNSRAFFFFNKLFSLLYLFSICFLSNFSHCTIRLYVREMYNSGLIIMALILFDKMNCQLEMK